MNTITAIPYPVRIVYQPDRMLVCDTCQQWTRHTLNASRTAYVCGCGTQIVYIINNAPPCEGIRL